MGAELAQLDERHEGRGVAVVAVDGGANIVVRQGLVLIQFEDLRYVDTRWEVFGHFLNATAEDNRRDERLQR